MNKPELHFDRIRTALELNPDNFVKLERTPWAGEGLSRGIKSAFAKQKVGESWEFSIDEAYHSRILAPFPYAGLSLRDFFPTNNIEILVKLINAASPLSYQVHPKDDHSALLSTECGKPESWLVISAEPGAGVYIGLKRPWARSELLAALRSGTFNSEDLHFVPVRAGDFFDIAPGVPHALGAGTVIYEPQRVVPGRSGVTWRLWDWGRLYGADGVTQVQDPRIGKPRPAQIDLGVGICSPEHQTGPVLEMHAKRNPTGCIKGSGFEFTIWSPNEFYTVGRLRCATNIAGRLQIDAPFGTAAVTLGEWQSDLGSCWTQGASLLFPRGALPINLRVPTSATSEGAEMIISAPGAGVGMQFAPDKL